MTTGRVITAPLAGRRGMVALADMGPVVATRTKAMGLGGGGGGEADGRTGERERGDGPKPERTKHVTSDHG